jgi:2-polyprenyl-6-methoxyphenol hydroxylase-like FAD-dependent oxidoreductase
LGDIISFGPNAGRIYRRWSNGAIADRLKPLTINLENHGFKIHKWTGELVHTQLAPPADPDAPVFNGHRGELHTVVFNYAKDELGIPIHLGQRVSKYFEDEKEAGIVLESGERVRQYLAFLLMVAQTADWSSGYCRCCYWSRWGALKGARARFGLL